MSEQVFAWAIGFLSGASVAVSLIAGLYRRDLERLRTAEHAHRVERMKFARLIAGAVEGPGVRH